MNYFFLFLICFVPLVSLKWSLSRPASSSSSSPGVFSFTHSRGKAASPPPPPAPSPPPPPPSPGMLYRLFALLWRTATPRARTRARARVPPFPPPPSSSSYSSQYSYFASPPVVRIPTSPSPVSRWFSSSSSSHGGRTRARKAPSWTSRDRFRRTPPLSTYARARNVDGVITMTAFLGTEGSNVDVDLVVLMAHVQAACKHIASLLATPRELQQDSASSAYETEFRSFGGDDNPRPMITISVGFEDDDHKSSSSSVCSFSSPCHLIFRVYCPCCNHLGSSSNSSYHHSFLLLVKEPDQEGGKRGKERKKTNWIFS